MSWWWQCLQQNPETAAGPVFVCGAQFGFQAPSRISFHIIYLFMCVMLLLYEEEERNFHAYCIDYLPYVQQ